MLIYLSMYWCSNCCVGKSPSSLSLVWLRVFSWGFDSCLCLCYLSPFSFLPEDRHLIFNMYHRFDCEKIIYRKKMKLRNLAFLRLQIKIRCSLQIHIDMLILERYCFWNTCCNQKLTLHLDISRVIKPLI